MEDERAGLKLQAPFGGKRKFSRGKSRAYAAGLTAGTVGV